MMRGRRGGEQVEEQARDASWQKDWKTLLIMATSDKTELVGEEPQDPGSKKVALCE